MKSLGHHVITFLGRYALERFCGTGELQGKDSCICAVSGSCLVTGAYSQIRVKPRMFVIKATKRLNAVL